LVSANPERVKLPRSVTSSRRVATVKPALAGDSIKPGVKRSGTPGNGPYQKILRARETGDRSQ
jgi:hypothetical protein